MFLSYYKLQTNPFKISSDPKFLWMGEKHKEALATLMYGISDNKGFLLLTGDVGSGKTTLINALINKLDENILVAVISDPGLSQLDFFNYIGYLFNFQREFKSKGEFIVHFSMFLNGVHTTGKKVLLIIDEAQRMPDELLEEVRLLSNIEKQDQKLINIFFVGQNEFNTMLLKETNRALKQRLALNYNIDSLNEKETEQYIIHRLKVAGGKAMLFTPEAVTEIHKSSGGYPRQINIVCDLALLSGYVKEKKKIGKEIIEECVKELNISPTTVEKTTQSTEEKGTLAAQRGSDELAALIPPPEGRRYKKRIFALIAFVCLGLLSAFLFFAYPTQSKRILESAQYQISLLSNKVLTLSGMSSPPKDAQQNNVTAPTVEKEHIDNSPPPPPIDEAAPISQDDEKKKNTYPKSVKNSNKNLSNTIQNGSHSDHIVNKTPAVNNGLSKRDTLSSPPVKKSEADIDFIVNASLPANSKESMGESRKTGKEAPKTGTRDIEIEKAEEKISKPVKTDPAYLDKKIIIRFGYNSNDLSKESRDELRKLTALLVEDKSRTLTITGHTDSVGNAAYNVRLSKFRANIVKSFLVGSGVEPDQLIVEGKGGREPIASNGTATGRRKNRRVEVEFAK